MRSKNPRTRVLSPGKASGLALASAILCRLAQPGWDLSFLAWVGLAPFFWVVLAEKKKARLFFYTLVFGLAHFGLAVDWLRVFSPWTSPFALYGGWIFYALYHALGLGIFVLVFKFFQDRKSPAHWAAVLGLSALWTLFTWARARGWSANSLGELAYTQADFPLFFRTASLWGAHGLTFLLVLANALTAAFFLQTRAQARFSGPWVALAAFALLAGGGVAASSGPWKVAPDKGEPLALALYQPNIKQKEKLDKTNNPAVKKKLLQGVAMFGKDRQADLLVLPETIVLEFLLRDKKFLYNLALATPAPLLFGAPRQGQAQDLFYNSIISMGPMGEERGHWDKERLVPLYEYTPFPNTLGQVLGPGHRAWEYSAGSNPGPLEGWIGAMVCFESTLPGLARRLAGQGAELLVVCTNDAWFRGTAFARQHLAFARMRAVENGLWLVQASNTGITAAVDPQGRLTAQSPENQEAWLEATVHRRPSATLFNKTGQGPVLLLCLALVLALALRRKRGPSPKKIGK